TVIILTYIHILFILFIFTFFPFFFFFFNAPATPDIYTLSLHDALPISHRVPAALADHIGALPVIAAVEHDEQPPVHQAAGGLARSEEHTSELQSLAYLVCRLLLEKKKKKKKKKE